MQQEALQLYAVIRIIATNGIAYLKLNHVIQAIIAIFCKQSNYIQNTFLFIVIKEVRWKALLIKLLQNRPAYRRLMAGAYTLKVLIMEQLTMLAFVMTCVKTITVIIITLFIKIMCIIVVKQMIVISLVIQQLLYQNVLHLKHLCLEYFFMYSLNRK